MDADIQFLNRNPVTLFLDVGANIGQTGLRIRRAGYTGRIISFEPIASCFDKLADAAKNDPLWQVHRTAIGARDGKARIGVSENLVSSSILDATDELLDIHAPIRYGRHESVPLARLDTVVSEYATPEDRIHLKIDTQGFERFVIEGATGCLSQVNSVCMEVAVSEVYRGEMVVSEALVAMKVIGYVLVDAWPAWRHPDTDEVLHFDLLFRRQSDRYGESGMAP